MCSRSHSRSGRELAARELRVDLRQVLAQARPQLGGDQVPERVRREVAEQPGAPVHVLQHALGGVGHVDAEQPVHALVPRRRQVVDRERALDQRQLELEAQDDVEVVGRLVGVDADQRALDGVDRAVEGVGVDAARDPRAERLAQDRQHPAAERARAADDVLPQPALGLVDAERDRLAERAARELGRDARLVEAVAELVQGGEVGDAEVVQVVAGGDADVGRAERLRERVRRGVEPPAVGVEADRLEHVHHRAALVVDLERAGEDAVVARLVAVARGLGRRASTSASRSWANSGRSSAVVSPGSKSSSSRS